MTRIDQLATPYQLHSYLQEVNPVTLNILLSRLNENPYAEVGRQIDSSYEGLGTNTRKCCKS